MESQASKVSCASRALRARPPIADPCLVPGGEQDLPQVVEAAARALRHSADAEAVDLETLNNFTDDFVHAVQVRCPRIKLVARLVSLICPLPRRPRMRRCDQTSTKRQSQGPAS
jgi:hypothetical protein